jgi:4-amino-4-deoxy-L-arabinose transferase
MNRTGWLGLTLGVVLAAAALLLTVRSGDLPLIEPDETRFAQTSVEMLRTGDLVVPRFGDEPRLVKPPLLHWIQSFVFHWSGPTVWAVRLHAFASTLGSLLLAAWIARRRWGPEGGAWAATMLATMPLVLVAGRVGTLDALLAVHVLAVLSLELGFPGGAGPPLRAPCVGALLGLAFLVKGPVGVLLPLLAMLAGRIATGRAPLPSAASLVRGTAAWLVVVLPWALAFVDRVGWSAVKRLLRDEVLARYVHGGTHAGPSWYYLGAVLAGCSPWVAPLLRGLVRAWQRRRDPGAEAAVYSAAGLVAGLSFLSLGRDKLATYMLPLAPLAAFVATWEVGQEVESPKERAGGAAAQAGSVAAIAMLLWFLAGRSAPGAWRSAAVAGAAAHGLAAAVAAYGALRRRPRLVHGSAAAAAWMSLLAATILLVPEIGSKRSVAPLVDNVPELRTRPVVTVEMKVPGLTFYLGRAPEVVSMTALEQRIDRPDAPLYVFAETDLPSAPSRPMAQLREIGRHAKYRVLEESPQASSP